MGSQRLGNMHIRRFKQLRSESYRYTVTFRLTRRGLRIIVGTHTWTEEKLIPVTRLLPTAQAQLGEAGMAYDEVVRIEVARVRVHFEAVITFDREATGHEETSA